MKKIIKCAFISFFILSAGASSAHEQETARKEENIKKEVKDIFERRERIKKQCANLSQDEIGEYLYDASWKDSNRSDSLFGDFLKNACQLIIRISGVASTISPFMPSFDYRELIRVTSSNATQFYEVIKEISDKLSMPIPRIFIVDNEDFINAMALSTTQNTGIVLIGKRPALNFSYESLRSTIAHECGHIEKYHAIKRFFVFAGFSFGFYLFGSWCCGGLPRLRDDIFTLKSKRIDYRKEDYMILLTSIIAAFLLLLKYCVYTEKEADLVELSITNDPNALNGSLQELCQMECERFHEKEEDFNRLIGYTEENCGQVDYECHEKTWYENWLKKMKCKLFSIKHKLLSSIKTHPTDEERSNYAYNSVGSVV